MENGVAPNWYRGRKSTNRVRYYGSISSIQRGEIYVPEDITTIVTRDDNDRLSVMDNVCLHAGGRIFTESGSHGGVEVRCPIHRWLYDKHGELKKCPNFTKKEGARLHQNIFTLWNGYILGYREDELEHLKGFGSSFGLSEDHLHAQHFIYATERKYTLDYDLWLMAINYLDGLHVQYSHPLSFDAVADSESYRWEIRRHGSGGYSLQMVQLRKNLEQYVAMRMRTSNKVREELGWANLVMWMRENMPAEIWKTDVEYFALWGLDYRSLLMWEGYLNGLFFVTSDVFPRVPRAVEDDNLNVVEYYISPRIPEHLRRIALDLFIRAYEQSAREDDVLCRSLWSAHKNGDLRFNRSVHDLYEKGDHDFRQWVMENSV